MANQENAHAIPNPPDLVQAIAHAARQNNPNEYRNLLEQFLQANAPAQPAAPAPALAQANMQAPRPRLPDPPKPEFFQGRSDKPPTAKSWLFSVNAYLASWPEMNEASKVAMAAAFLRENAAVWWEHLQENVQSGHREPITTCAEFAKALQAQFGGHDREKNARDLLATLTQTHSVQAYTKRFQELLIMIGRERYTDSEMQHRYVFGLKPWLQQIVKADEPDSLEDTMRKAERIASVRVVGAPHRKSGRDIYRNQGRFKGNSHGNSDNLEAGPAPMDCDQVTVSRPKLTAEEKERLRKNNGCFYCREENVSHSARNCPQKNNRSN